MSNTNLAKAKALLILDNPFFASLLLSMEFKETKDVPTFATDGESILVNPDFLATLTVPEIKFVLAHEVMHCVFQHMFRLGDKDHSRWNIATDYIINDLLSRESDVGTMPSCGLLDADIVKRGGGTAEGVYNLLPESMNGQNGPQAGQKGGPMDQLIKPQAPDEATMNQKEAEMRVKVAQARNAAKMRGALSAGLNRLVEDCLKTETDWRTILRRFLSEKSKTDLSYSRPKRRFLAEDICLPSLTGEKMGAMVVAVDCSGSVDNKTLGIFEKEIKSILSDVMPSEIRVVYFDSEVLNTEVFNEDRPDVKLNAIGGGGTAYSPIFESLKDLDSRPVAVVVLTDMYCNDFGPIPEIPVLWASYGRKDDSRKLPFGELIQVKGEK